MYFVYVSKTKNVICEYNYIKLGMLSLLLSPETLILRKVNFVFSELSQEACGREFLLLATLTYSILSMMIQGLSKVIA